MASDWSEIELRHWAPGISSAQAAHLSKENELLRLSTCLRTLSISLQDFSSQNRLPNGCRPPSEILCGQEAYVRILEVICGLHSPILGETEVLGQFKISLNQRLAEITRHSEEIGHRVLHNQLLVKKLEDLGQALLVDCKKVRSRFLTDLGSQSYGSVVRKVLRAELPADATELINVGFIGGGQLTQEIYPWVAKIGFKVMIGIRNLDKKAVIQKNLGIESQDEIQSIPAVVENSDVLIIAAPVSNAKLQELLAAKKQGNVRLLIDLRGEFDSEKEADSIDGFQGRHVSLKEIFQSLELTRKRWSERKTMAKDMIHELAEERYARATYRPFGWEDFGA